ncbi:MAG: TonB C-terminal domain-containing protein [Desulfuromonadales bacterium]|nr:MAG: TonB C-terminal domain-containing protein [Desulfuromonadales bacterium]
MELHPFLIRHPAGLGKAVVFSVMLHGALALIVSFMPRHLVNLGPSQIVSVSLSDLDSPPHTDPPATATHTQAPQTPAPREMIVPAPAEATPPEPPLPEAKDVKTEQSVARTEESSLSLGMARGFFRSLADGQTLRPDVRDYYFALVQRINDQWWTVAGSGGVEPGRGEALVTIVMRRDGELLDVRLMKSSGSPDYDRMILNALQAATPLPPLPESYPGDIFQAPLRLMAPRGLLFS